MYSSPYYNSAYYDSPYYGVSGVATAILAAVEELTLTTYSAVVSLNTTINATLETLALTTYPSAIIAGIEIAAAVQNMLLTTYPGVIMYDGRVWQVQELDDSLWTRCLSPADWVDCSEDCCEWVEVS